MELMVYHLQSSMFIHPWYDSDSSLEMKETFWILPKECKWAPVMPNSPIDMTGLTHDSLMPMADPEYGTPSRVHVLLGVGCFARAIIRVVARTLDGTAIMETTVGNIVFGYNGENDDEQNGQIATAIEYSPEQQMDRLLERLWQQDQIGNHSKWTKEEQIEEHFMKTHYRDKSGRFVVKIPVDENITDIGSSRAVAMKRFMFLERRFLKDSELKEAYVEQMRKMIRLGYLKLATERPLIGEMVYYIPHHCLTKKTRIVNDASCNTDRGISLNDIQLLGPKLQRDLHETVMRLRRHKVAVCPDIKKMFNQVRVNKE